MIFLKDILKLDNDIIRPVRLHIERKCYLENFSSERSSSGKNRERVFDDR